MSILTDLRKRVDGWLREVFPQLSSRHIEEAIQEGLVTVSGKKTKKGHRVLKNELEFTAEFYRVHCDYLTTRQDMKDFIATLSGQSVSFKEISVEAAFHTYANIALADMASAALFLNEARRIGIYSLTESDSWEDIFFRIMMERIEPALPPQTPTLIYDYPASVSTLSQPKGKHWGERFEIYWHQMELCNGATELIDSSVLKNRYEFEKQERIKAGKEPHPFPRTLFEVIDRLPPCSGVAVGLDRLFWALNSTNTPNSI
ncbi:MAG: hypothetical protein EB078_07265 [Proteobacteria bacterium]|nr:hypothetical protein [Pseudomonadota bacterium]